MKYSGEEREGREVDDEVPSLKVKFTSASNDGDYKITTLVQGTLAKI